MFWSWLNSCILQSLLLTSDSSESGVDFSSNDLELSLSPAEKHILIQLCRITLDLIHVPVQGGHHLLEVLSFRFVQRPQNQLKFAEHISSWYRALSSVSEITLYFERGRYFSALWRIILQSGTPPVWFSLGAAMDCSLKNISCMLSSESHVQRLLEGLRISTLMSAATDSCASLNLALIIAKARLKRNQVSNRMMLMKKTKLQVLVLYMR